MVKVKGNKAIKTSLGIQNIRVSLSMEGKFGSFEK